MFFDIKYVTDIFEVRSVVVRRHEGIRGDSYFMKDFCLNHMYKKPSLQNDIYMPTLRLLYNIEERL